MRKATQISAIRPIDTPGGPLRVVVAIARPHARRSTIVSACILTPSKAIESAWLQTEPCRGFERLVERASPAIAPGSHRQYEEEGHGNGQDQHCQVADVGLR
jgi:hypothetical protein